MLLYYIILGVIGLLLIVDIILLAGASSKVKKLKEEKAKGGQKPPLPPYPIHGDPKNIMPTPTVSPVFDMEKATASEDTVKKADTDTQPLPQLDFLKQDKEDVKPAYTGGIIAADPNSPLLAGIKKSDEIVEAPPLFATPTSMPQKAGDNVTVGLFGNSSMPAANPMADTGKTVALYNTPAPEKDSDKTVMIMGAGRKVSYINLAAANGQKFRAAIDPEVTIGRKTGQILLNFEPSISGTHCKINKFGSVYTITDMNSSNGTFVNGAKIESPTQVKTGDKILLGRLELTLTIED